ncbi:MAG TPA: hypothetical protein PLE14_04775 [Anaerolineales bacterium]|nr:hypothetical protein [Anaerolineales bacterium]
MTKIFSCPACGGPNEPDAGEIRMICSYCGVNLTIPEEARIRAKPKVESKPPKAMPTSRLEKEAPDLLRKAQPIAIKAWNTYAYWTWIRWLLPTCLTIFMVGFFICLAFGALPFMLNLFR